jgi:hypothetical protein
VGFASSEFDGIAHLYKKYCDVTGAYHAPSVKNVSTLTPDKFVYYLSLK